MYQASLGLVANNHTHGERSAQSMASNLPNAVLLSVNQAQGHLQGQQLQQLSIDHSLLQPDVQEIVERMNALVRENEKLKVTVGMNNSTMFRALHSLQQLRESQTGDSANNSISELKAEKSQLENRIREMQTELDQMRNARCSDCDNSVTAATINRLEAENLQLSNKCSELRQEVEDEKRLHGSTQKNLAQTMKEYHDLLQQSDQLTRSLTEVQGMLRTKQEQLERQCKEIDDLKARAVMAEIYEADFHMERKSKEDLNDVKLFLESRVMELEAQVNELRAVSHSTGPAPSYTEYTVEADPLRQGSPRGSTPSEHLAQHQPSDQIHHRPVQEQEGRRHQEARQLQQQSGQQLVLEQQRLLQSVQPESQLTRQQQLQEQQNQWQQQQQRQQQLHEQMDQWRQQQHRQQHQHERVSDSLGTTEILDAKCPFCQLLLPDYDTLQLHVNDNHPETS